MLLTRRGTPIARRQYKFYADDPQTILQSLVRLCGERIHRSLSDLHLLIPDVASCITEPVIQGTLCHTQPASASACSTSTRARAQRTSRQMFVDFEAAMVRERATYYGSLVVTREALYFVQYGPQDRREIRVSLPLASIKSASEYVDITKLPTSLAIETRANETVRRARSHTVTNCVADWMMMRRSCSPRCITARLLYSPCARLSTNITNGMAALTQRQRQRQRQRVTVACPLVSSSSNADTSCT